MRAESVYLTVSRQDGDVNEHNSIGKHQNLMTHKNYAIRGGLYLLIREKDKTIVTRLPSHVTQKSSSHIETSLIGDIFCVNEDIEMSKYN